MALQGSVTGNLVVTSGGAVTVSGGTIPRLYNDSALALQGSVTGNLAVTSGGGDFNSTSGGAISDSAALAVSGTSSFTDSTNAGITLDTQKSDGAVTVSGGDTSIDNGSTDLSVQGAVKGNIQLKSEGSITASELTLGDSDSGTNAALHCCWQSN